MIRKLVRFFVHSLRILRIDSFQRFFEGFLEGKLSWWIHLDGCHKCVLSTSHRCLDSSPFFEQVFFILCCFAVRMGLKKALEVTLEGSRSCQEQILEVFRRISAVFGLWPLLFWGRWCMSEARERPKQCLLRGKQKDFDLCARLGGTHSESFDGFLLTFGHVLKTIPENSHNMLPFKKTHGFFQGKTRKKNGKSTKRLKKKQKTTNEDYPPGN